MESCFVQRFSNTDCLRRISLPHLLSYGNPSRLQGSTHFYLTFLCISDWLCGGGPPGIPTSPIQLPSRRGWSVCNAISTLPKIVSLPATPPGEAMATREALETERSMSLPAAAPEDGLNGRLSRTQPGSPVPSLQSSRPGPSPLQIRTTPIGAHSAPLLRQPRPPIAKGGSLLTGFVRQGLGRDRPLLQGVEKDLVSVKFSASLSCCRATCRWGRMNGSKSKNGTSSGLQK